MGYPIWRSSTGGLSLHTAQSHTLAQLHTGQRLSDTYTHISHQTDRHPRLVDSHPPPLAQILPYHSPHLPSVRTLRVPGTRVCAGARTSAELYAMSALRPLKTPVDRLLADSRVARGLPPRRDDGARRDDGGGSASCTESMA